MTPEQIAELSALVRAAGIPLFSRQSYESKHDAQRNLCDRTHYVDDSTLRFHYCRILDTRHSTHGLLFGLVESVALDPRNTRRGFRAVIFDVFGSVVTRSDLEGCHKTKAPALRELESLINGDLLLPQVAENMHSRARTMRRDADAIQAAAEFLSSALERA